MAMRIMPPAAEVEASTCAAPQAQAAGAGDMTASPENAPTGSSSLRLRSAAPAFFSGATGRSHREARWLAFRPWRVG